MSLSLSRFQVTIMIRICDFIYRRRVKCVLVKIKCKVCFGIGCQCKHASRHSYQNSQSNNVWLMIENDKTVECQKAILNSRPRVGCRNMLLVIYFVEVSFLGADFV